MEDPFGGTEFTFDFAEQLQLEAQLPPQLPAHGDQMLPLHALTKFMRTHVFSQSPPPPHFSLTTRNILMRNKKLAEMLSEQLPAQAEPEHPVQPHPEHPVQPQPEQSVQPQPEQTVQPLPLDALTFSAWTTVYSNLEYLYRLYVGASYERPLEIQEVGSNIDIRFNVGNFMFQLAADRVRNEGRVTDRRAILMSTILAMTFAAFLGCIMNALKKTID